MSDPSSVRIAAAGDVHCHEANREHVREAFARLAGTRRPRAAGRRPDDARRARAGRSCWPTPAATSTCPSIAVLGNHDWHVNRAGELIATLEDAGIRVLERDSTVVEHEGTEIGIVGAKGFVGGFPGCHLPDFGEPLLREVYAEACEEAEAVDAGLRAVAHCPVRIVLLHYAPIAGHARGRAPPIWTMLGSDRLAAPDHRARARPRPARPRPRGHVRGTLGTVPVYNVSVPVMAQDFWVFEVADLERATTPVH